MQGMIQMTLQERISWDICGGVGRKGRSMPV
jgi:hypothetical protein